MNPLILRIRTIVYFSLVWICYADSISDECAVGSCKAANPETLQQQQVNNDENDACLDLEDDCVYLKPYCISGFEKISQMCPKTCKICGYLNETHFETLYSEMPQLMFYEDQDKESNQEMEKEFWDYVDQVDNYMYTKVFNKSMDHIFEPVREECRNKNENCMFWGFSGECEKNPRFMELECSPACLRCEHYSPDSRCRYDWTEPKAWSEPGNLHTTFTRIVTDPQFAAYNVKTLSQPESDSEDTTTGSPWIVALENFLNETECQVLQELGSTIGYKPSLVAPYEKPNRTSGPGEHSVNRTSTQAWCRGPCQRNGTVRALMNRVEHMIQIPQSHFESLQLLHYEEGQFYKEHSDYIDFEKNRHHGPRILTVFLYLNQVESGGETRFTKLDSMVVSPKCGSALIWPSVLDKYPMYKDLRMDHESLPIVGSSAKYAANIWVHQRDYQTLLDTDCL